MRQRLREIVGGEHLDDRDGKSFTAHPGSVAEVSRLVALARTAGWRVAPRGGGTRDDPANRENPPELLIETTRLNRCLFHEPGDLVASFEAGVDFRSMQEQLAAAGQWLPLDPPTEAGSTLGGVLATDAFGPARIGFGTARDRLLGTSLVRFDGEVVESGGIVVKNVAGYDLSRLWLGAGGAFGILVSANLKLAPRPEEVLGIFRRCDLEAAGELVAGLRAAHAPLLAALWREDLLRLVLAVGPDEIPPGLTADGESSSSPTTPMRSPLLLRLHYPEARVREVAARIPEEARTEFFVGEGVVRVGFPTPPPDDRVLRLCEELDRFLAEQGGYLVLERVPPGPARRLPRGFLPAPAAELAQRLKKALDPDGIFPPLPFATRGAGR